MASLKAALSAVAFCACAVSASSAVAGTVSLGSFTFNSDQFGDTLSQSDGGTYAAANWVNIVASDPGSPAYLTGANFDTGIANIGLTGPVSYTIGYNTPITNNSGADIGVVTARFSFGDAVTLTINGITKTYGPDPDPAISTGVSIPYYYAPSPLLQPADLWVTLIDLNDFSVAGGASINSLVVTGSPELDLIRVAGLIPSSSPSETPLPAALPLFASGLGALGLFGWRRKKRAAALAA